MTNPMSEWIARNVPGAETSGNTVTIRDTETGHGPDPCDGCGKYHSHVRLHMDENGQPWPDDEPTLLDEVLAVMDDYYGRPLVKADISDLIGQLRKERRYRTRRLPDPPF